MKCYIIISKNEYKRKVIKNESIQKIIWWIIDIIWKIQLFSKHTSKIQIGKLTFNANDIKIIHTDENKTKDILNDLNTILTDLHEIEPENEKLDVFIMIILDQGETMKVTAMIAK